MTLTIMLPLTRGLLTPSKGLYELSMANPVHCAALLLWCDEHGDCGQFTASLLAKTDQTLGMSMWPGEYDSLARTAAAIGLAP